ncbi:hypothetical protein TRVL_02540 [Trypanosoma vivax]|uniref:AAA+ ATPase domain-containing protein n=1 Tax=Trypanosoma vivax (strain Y486) TaxID=1055687 RepID=G0U8G9_TRYVY|nr:hypothetical protein TRVL_02540 [Trypanosoma vivax]CCC53895.1 conserved hypothetical protein [Trypanosoma vivax Y486]
MGLLDLHRSGVFFISGTAVSASSIFVLILTSFCIAVSAHEEVTDEPSCPRAPICSRGSPFALNFMRYCLLSKLPGAFVSKELPFYSKSEARRLALESIEELLRSRVVGQGHMLSDIIAAMRRKLSTPQEPLVLHFAGDNGVGKTHTARLLSLATSLRCAPLRRPLCDTGDNLLTISGTSYEGLNESEARHHIVKLITTHQRRYPHGIVLLDDLNVMHPKLVATLAPLFGRAERFAEQPPDAPSLAQLTVIVTTDFGRQGRTFGKSVVEVGQMVRDEFSGLYGALVSSFTRTFLFVSFSRSSAEELVRATVASLPCTVFRYGSAASAEELGTGGLVESRIDDLAVSFIVERHREVWEGRENGHALRRVVEDTLLPLLSLYFDSYGHDRQLRALFRFHVERAEVVLDAGDGMYSMEGWLSSNSGATDGKPEVRPESSDTGGTNSRVPLGDL